MADRRFQLLVVDDDPALRGALAALLQLEGYEVTVAESLEDAQRAAQNLPDLVLLDRTWAAGRAMTLGAGWGAGASPFLMLEW